jgi:WD40 repeat protein
MWDTATGRELRCFRGHTGQTTGVAITSDGRRVVSVSLDRTVRMWDAATGKEVRRWDAHVGPIWGLAVSPDGTRAASGGGDGALKVWDLAVPGAAKQVKK